MRSEVLRGLAATLLVAGALLAGCSKASTPDPGAAPAAAGADRVSGDEARALVKGGGLLLDVRTPEEFADGHIEGAKNIPVDRVAAELGQLSRDRPIVLYCATGRRTRIALRTLKAAGLDVRDMGPMAAWK